MTRDEQIIEYAATMARELPSIRPLEILQIAKLAKTHGTLAENQCNRELSKSEQTREANIEHEIAKILGKYGASALFSHDPRGCTVKVVVPSGHTNDFGQEGICVPQ